MSTAVLVRDRLTWLAYGQLGVFGYFFYGFGPVVSLLREEQHTSRGVAALHGTTFAIGGALGAAMLPALVRRFGRQTVAWAALAVLCLVVAGFWVLRPLWGTLPLALAASASGSMVINTALAALADRHGPAGPAAISEGNALAASIGLLGPLGVGATVGVGLGWRPGLAVTIILIGLLAAAALALRIRTPAARPAKVPGRGRYASSEPARSLPETTEEGRLPRSYRLVWVCVFALASIELCFNLWVADVLRTHSGASAGIATGALSVIVAGMVVGRLIGGRLLLRLPAARVLLGALVVSCLGFAVFWLAPAPGLAVAGLVVLGLGNGVHFPLGMALAVEHSGGQPDLAVARATYALSLAFGASPFLLGVLADGVGPHTAFLLVPVFLAVAMVIAWRLTRRGPAAVGAAVPDLSGRGRGPG